MVKAYHGENMEFQLCCSDWTTTENQTHKKNMLTKGMGMDDQNEKGENDNVTNWNNSNESSKMGMCNGWSELDNMKFIPLEPPPEFQDRPPSVDSTFIEKFAAKLVSKLITEALLVSCKITWSIPCSQICHMSDTLPLHGNSVRWSGLRLCWTPELMPYSPCHGNRPGSRNSLSSSRLSSSHNSLSVAKADDSSFITSAMSHDTLTSNQISDMYNVPFDSDIYAVPVDVVKPDNPKPPPRTKKRHHRKRRQQPSEQYILPVTPSKGKHSSHKQPLKAVRSTDIASDSGNRPGGTSRQPRSASAGCSNSEPIHLTLQEVRQYLHTLYSSSSDSSENKHLQETIKRFSNPFKAFSNSENNNNNISSLNNNNNNINNNTYYRKNSRNTIPVKNKKAKDNFENTGKDLNKFDTNEKLKKSSCRPSFSTNIKQTLCNIFRFKKLPSPDQCLGKREVISRSDEIGVRLSGHDDQNPPSPITKPPFSKRALPPLPRFEDEHGEIIVTDSTPLPSPEETPPPEPPPLPVRDKEQGEQTSMDFASSIEKVKDYGWYWGPISGEAAERILSNEPDGSFIVRDSSDDYYIFSLTFKLNSIVRHVRIEHDQGNFSFGSSTRFKSHTIVDFIESAVEHSRSGRYLFFLHRRPILGPMRVQLLHPVSRFKEVQSLQHMCRFVILKYVRRDLIPNLPLPKRILEYLSTQHYYSEHFIEEDRTEYPPAKEDLDQILSVMHEGFS